MTDTQPEVWQRGPVADVPALLQPVAHALLQAGEEVHESAAGIPENKLWVKPYGLASAGFHLQHVTGVADRLFTYARNELLTEKQLQFVSNEGKESAAVNAAQLAEAFRSKVAACVNELKTVDANCLSETRYIGRKKIPTTAIGLYVHCAEHIMRHVGQLFVTARIIKNLQQQQLNNSQP